MILGANKQGSNTSVAISVDGKGGSGNVGGTVKVTQTGTILTSGGGADAILGR